MRVHIIAFGKLKTPGLREAAEYYLKLIRPWVALEECELKSLTVPSDKSAVARKQIQEKETELLFNALSSRLGSRGFFYLMDETGKAFATRDWAKQIQSWEGNSIPDLAICLGSSLGFSPELKGRAKGLLSLGPQTFPHELARVVLLDQLYRAWSVTRGHPYHNE